MTQLDQVFPIDESPTDVRREGPLVISVVGCGYLGAVHAAGLAALGHQVIGIEADVAKANSLASGRTPFFEPGLEETLQDGLQSSRLSFSSDISAVSAATVHFICVGTPQKKGENSADLSHVDAAVAQLLPYLKPGDVVVGKSTVPVGTAERLGPVIVAAQPGAALAWNPEFLREGHAVQDTLRPDRLVFGVGDNASGARASSILRAVYAKPLADGVPLITTDFTTAQLVKVAANSFLATKISFINAMAELCEATGGDVVQLLTP